MSKIYDNLESSAIKSIEINNIIGGGTVNIVYNSNTSKVYSYNCEDTNVFELKLSEVIHCVANKLPEWSVGKFINQQVKDSVLVENK